jgi:hypothetical protein
VCLVSDKTCQKVLEQINTRSTVFNNKKESE